MTGGKRECVTPANYGAETETYEATGGTGGIIRVQNLCSAEIRQHDPMAACNSVLPPVPPVPPAVRIPRNLPAVATRAGQHGLHLPCPSDLVERAAMIEEGDGIDREAAERRALTEHGFASWSALALAHADRITIELDRLPPPCDATGARLLAGTLKLITGPHWLACVAAGWPVCDVFGVDPWAPIARQSG